MSSDEEKGLSNPEQLDNLLVVVTRKAWITLISLLILAFAVILWAIFGSIPITLEGRGIVMNPQGLMVNIPAEWEGTVRQVDVKAGDSIEKGSKIAEIFDFRQELKAKKDKETRSSYYSVYSPYSGHVLEVLTSIGDRVVVGSPLVWIEYFSEEKALHFFYGYFPIEQGKRIIVGMKVDIELSSVNSQEYGHLMGTVKAVSDYAVSKESIIKMVHSKELTDYLAWGTQAVVEVLIDVKRTPGALPGTPEEYEWSSGKIPGVVITSGTVCKINAIVERVRPIYYILPLSSFKR